MKLRKNKIRKGGLVYMDNERLKELLTRLVDVIVDRIELDGATELLTRIGFTENELMEIVFGENSAEKE